VTIDPETFVQRVRAGESLAGLDLTEADPFMYLSGLDLRDADLSRPQLPEAAGGREWAVRFTDTTRRAMRHVRVRGADLSGARLDRVLGSRGDFRRALLVGASPRSADLREANFELADARGADFSGSNLEGARFHGPNRTNRLSGRTVSRRPEAYSEDLGIASSQGFIDPISCAGEAWAGPVLPTGSDIRCPVPTPVSSRRLRILRRDGDMS
jgi:uncharacterized protein YjbI with pentapeptide repeats